MKFWIESLQENAFDVFQVVWIGVAIFFTHFLMRWYISNKVEELKDAIDKKKK
tara:strand:- start:83 stop:241 length:159 start_codon:yes stop_codon:yes gene_type:complete